MDANDATARPATKRAPPRSAAAEFTVRALSAAAMAPTAIALVYFGTPGVEIMLAAIGIVLAWEWTRLTGVVGDRRTIIVIAVSAIAGVAAVAIGNALIGLTILACATVLAWALGRAGRRLWAAAGNLYIGAPLIAFEWLRTDPAHGRETAIWLLVAVWATDIGAYLVGRRVGGPKLAPAISPGKTWAGLVGGVACAGAVGAAAAAVLERPSTLEWTAASAAVGLVSQGGDLLESAVKRHFQVKDTSALIPGHGGLFDRLDGVLAATVAIALLSFAAGVSPLAWGR